MYIEPIVLLHDCHFSTETLEFGLFSAEVFSNSNGVVTSPRFPENYNNLASSNWLIQLPPGEYIEVTFLNFDVEDGDDCK